jgi:hypothetical protein
VGHEATDRVDRGARGALTAPALAEVPTSSTAQPSPPAEPIQPIAAAPSTEPAEAAADDWGAFAATAAAAPTKIFETRFYGYIDTYFESSFLVPDGIDAAGGIQRQDPQYGYDVLNLHAMVQGSIVGKYRYFLNLAARTLGSAGEDVALSVRNAWVEVPILSQHLQVRLGKTYRRFGLYNELLDAVPTFIGIEPPEMFDPDHLMLTRTTNLMLHGTFQPADAWTLSWALTTGNDERASTAVPVGADLRANWNQVFTFGASFYWSGGAAEPTRAVGEGSPTGGVINWMAEDHFWVGDVFAEVRTAGWILQAEAAYARHNAMRDPAAVALLAGAGLDARQRARFFVNGDPTQGTTNPDVTYEVFTTYFRGGYELQLADMTLTPYVQFDYYSNPETIRAKSFGGDGDEAGMSENGQFSKVTLGAVLRPVEQVALKLDGGAHVYEYAGKTDLYTEVRLSFSYLWDLGI